MSNNIKGNGRHLTMSDRVYIVIPTYQASYLPDTIFQRNPTNFTSTIYIPNNIRSAKKLGTDIKSIPSFYFCRIDTTKLLDCDCHLNCLLLAIL